MKKEYTRKFMINRIIYSILLLLLTTLVVGQEDTLSYPRAAYMESEIATEPFDQQDWERVKKGIDYSQAFEEDEFDDDEEESDTTARIDEDEIKSSSIQSSSNENLAFWSNFFKILFIVLIVVGVAFLAYRLVGDGYDRPKSRRFNPSSASILIEELEEDIHEHDLQHYIRQAVAEHNYALAVRLYYLAILKELSLSKRIKWKRDKTNREYLNEMRPSDLYTPFKETTRIFEWVWYGKGKLDEIDFNTLQPRFEQLVAAASQATPQSTVAEE